MAKAIESEWFYRPENGSCSYFDKRDKYHDLRLYGRGEQDTNLYKDLLHGGDNAEELRQLLDDLNIGRNNR